MKKISLLLSVLLLAVAVLSGCAAEAPASTSSAAPETGASAEASAESVEQTGGKDYTVEVETLKADKQALSEAAEMNAASSYRYDGSTLESIYKNADAIINCEVEDAAFAVLENDPYRVVNVRVLDSYKGNFQAGDRLTVAIFGGYISTADYAKSREDEDRFPNPTGYIELKDTDGWAEPYAEVGDRYVFGLKRHPLLKEEIYTPTTYNYTIYKLGENGRYTRFAATKAEQAKEQGKTYALPTTNSKESFTLDWFSAKMQRLAE